MQDLSFYRDMSAERKVKGNGISSLQYKEIINDFPSYYIISCFKQL